MDLINGVERLIMPRPVADRRRAVRETRDIAHLPDRAMLADHYIPAVADRGGTILWVGTRPYTALNYETLATGGGTVWTSDIDPDAARWGHPERHRTGDACRMDAVFPNIDFDTVIYNGVVGFGVDTPEDQARSLKAVAAVLKPGGLLIFGWNTDRVTDPLINDVIGPEYVATTFADHPSRVAFANSTHVYDVLVRV